MAFCLFVCSLTAASRNPTLKEMSQRNAKSKTFTLVSQYGANFEINFLTVYRNCWLTLKFQEEIRFPENQISR